MASSKVMASLNPTSSDHSTTTTSSRSPSSTKPQTNSHINTPSVTTADNMTVDGILSRVYASPSAESTLLDAQITLIDTPTPLPFEQANIKGGSGGGGGTHLEINDVLPTTPLPSGSGKTVEEVWREIVAGRREMKEEQTDEMMTLEDFLVKTGAVDGQDDNGGDVKMVQSESLSGGVFSFDPTPSSGSFHMLDKVAGSIVAFGSSGGSGSVRGKRGGVPAAAMEPLDKAAQQRQRRMIKNRESAARSRERKQAYQVELETLAVRLEEENEQLLKEKLSKSESDAEDIKGSENACSKCAGQIAHFSYKAGVNEERSKERLKQLMEKVIPVNEKRRPKRVLRRVNSLQW